jgi:hypothetical protein
MKSSRGNCLGAVLVLRIQFPYVGIILLAPKFDPNDYELVR